MRTNAYTTFETPIGTCAIAWGPRGVTATSLPGSSAERTAARVRRHPEAVAADPPQPVAAAIDGIRRLLGGERVDLSWVELDLAGVPELDREVGAAARTIPAGATVTYGELARMIGRPGAAREVGAALGRNRFPIIVPCHRVVAADGSLGGFSAPGGAATKRRLLELEGAQLTLV